MDYIKGFNRDQLVMMDFEANVAYDSWARVVDCFVDMLPIEKLGFKDVLNEQGASSLPIIRHVKITHVRI
jgi:hypothetical protein